MRVSPHELSGDATAQTDLEGRYELSNLRARYYKVTVTADGYRAAGIKAVKLPEERDFVLRPGLTIEGTFADHRGKPLPHATVVAWPTDWAQVRQVSSAQTDGQGRFLIKNLAPGIYRLETRTDFGERPPNATLEGVTAGASGVEIRLPEPGMISGRVRDEHGNPIQGIEVRAAPESDDMRGGGGGWTDQEGEFRIEGLHGEKFKVVANWNRQVLFEPGKPLERHALHPGYASSPLRNVSIGTKDLEIQRERGHEMSGVILGIDGLPAEGASIAIMAQDGNGPSGAVVAQADGQFLMYGLKPGTYRIEAWAKDGTRARLKAQAGDTNLRIQLKRQ